MSSALEQLLIAGTSADVAQAYATLYERSRDAAFGLIEPEYVVIDTETTGFSSERDALIEIAAARICGSEVLERFSTFVNPARPVPEVITELTGITDNDVAGAPDALSAVAALADFVGDAVPIAHNASFDADFIIANAPVATLKSHVPLVEPRAWIDSLELARIALPRLRDHKLESLSDAFAPARSTHRAIDDVDALCVVWRVMLVALSDLPPGLPSLVASIAPNTTWSLREVVQQVALAHNNARFDMRDARANRMLTIAKTSKYDAAEFESGALPLYTLDLDAVAKSYEPDALAGKMYADFEPRAEQVAMAREVAAALNEGTHRAIEAGTGVGKSMAYLLPMVQFARTNQITCGVATKTNALLDQLIYNELPRLDAALDNGLSYIALKGYDHYPCLRKAMRLARSNDNTYKDAAPIVAIAQTLSYVCQSTYGDYDPLPIRFGELARFEICASADDCMHNKCPFYGACLVHGARKAAKFADIVITNHSLLLCDIIADNSLLPPIRHWIVDEAHSFETEARRQLSKELSARNLLGALDALKSSHGVLASMRKMAIGLSGGELIVGKLDALMAEAQQTAVMAGSWFSFVKELTALAENSSYDQVDLWINDAVRESGAWGQVEGMGRKLYQNLDALAKKAADIFGLSNEHKELNELANDLSGDVFMLVKGRDVLAVILDGTDKSYVYSATLDRREDKPYDSLKAQFVDVGPELASGFYPLQRSIVFASATIATGEGFDYFAQASGLNLLQPNSWQTLALASSYDFERNMRVYLPTDMPEPNQVGYAAALEELLFAAHVALGGSVLTLFTNRREMERCYGSLRQRLEAEGLKLRCQLRGTSARRLRDDFVADRQLSLMALKSFWEGFDAPGDTLRCVIIPKLPFSRPNDPLQKERELRDRNAWRHYVLPEAVIDLKQAAGRLIRSSTDSGSLILADARLRTKFYGRSFLDALPSQQIQTQSIDEIAQSLEMM